ncbi:MAG: PBP1A family penicillin-binding protein [Bdellovibrionota bacterium]
MKLLKRIFIILLVGCGVAIIGGVTLIATYSTDLPNLDSLVHYSPKLVTTIYSKDDKVIASYAQERRIYIPPSETPEKVANAFVAAEDDEFYTHSGINPLTIVRAAFKNMRAGATVQGGSTITQQVAKSFLLSPEKSYKRKLKEVILAFRIEKALTKAQILNLYLNHIFLGLNSYGIEAAALTYFGKSAKDLSIAEAAMLAGLPRAPSRDNPAVAPRAAKHRQIYVINRLLATHKISKSEHDEALAEEIKIVNTAPGLVSPTPYLAEYVRRALIEKYGEERVNQGLSVYTTVNMDKQLAAQKAIDLGLREVDKRLGLRRPAVHMKTKTEIDAWSAKKHLELVKSFYNFRVIDAQGEVHEPVADDTPTPIEIGKNYLAVVVGKDRAKRSIKAKIGNRTGDIKPEDYRWVLESNPDEVYGEKVVRNPVNELQIGDVITVQPRVIDEKNLLLKLEQEPIVQGALISYDLKTGGLEAIVGGYDFTKTGSHFNRAFQAIRQPGSTFKPFVYGAALESGLTPSTVIVDSPIVYRNQDEQTQLENVWKPDNYGEKFYGDTLLRNAIAYSRNIPTVKLLQYLKVPTVINFARKLGIKSKLAPDLSLGLGSSGVGLDEMVGAWSIFANKGRRQKHYVIEKVLDWSGNVLEENKVLPLEEQEQVLDPKIAFLTTSLLRSVVEYGTATVVQQLKRPLAGKTGTTSDYRDAWFLGYSPQVIGGVWIGFDEDRPIGRNETGTRSAAPIWMSFMQEALKDQPVEDFEVPDGIIQVKIDSQTGDVPTATTQKTISEYFIDGLAPGQTAKVDEKSNLAALSGSNAPGVNKTQVITGNPDLSNARPTTGSPDAPGAGMDDLMRDDL